MKLAQDAPYLERSVMETDGYLSVVDERGLEDRARRGEQVEKKYPLPPQRHDDPPMILP